MVGFKWNLFSATLNLRNGLAQAETDVHGIVDLSEFPFGGVATLEATGRAGISDFTGPAPHTAVPLTNLDKDWETALVQYIFSL